jgi:hypothetical protein
MVRERKRIKKVKRVRYGYPKWRIRKEKRVHRRKSDVSREERNILGGGGAKFPVKIWTHDGD